MRRNNKEVNGKKEKIIRELNFLAFREIYPEGYTTFRCKNCNATGRVMNKYFSEKCLTCGKKVEILKMSKR